MNTVLGSLRLLSSSSSLTLIKWALIPSTIRSLTTRDGKWCWASVDVTILGSSWHRLGSCWYRLLCEDHLSSVSSHVHHREAILGPRDTRIGLPGIIVIIACWGIAAWTSRNVVFLFLLADLNLVCDNCLPRHQCHHAGLEGCLPINHLYAAKFALEVVSALAIHLEEVVIVFTGTHYLHHQNTVSPNSLTTHSKFNKKRSCWTYQL